MTNAKTKSDSLKLLSLNVRGLSNFRKRRAIFTWCRKQKADLIFLQETHSTEAGECKWKKEWGSEIIFSHGSSNARGVAVLIKRGLDIVIQQELLNFNGRSIILKALIKDKRYTLANIYGPNKDAEAVRFYQNLSATLWKMDADSDDNIVVGGDFNCPLNLTLDKKGGILIPRQHVINSIENVQNEFSLHDIWRIKNPNTRSFTWSRNHPFIFCRLDYWLISDKLNDLVKQVDIQASIKTDHSSIILELEDIKDTPKGPGFWKLNTSLLARPEYVEMISKELPNWLKDAEDLSDKRAKWDWLKFKIKSCSIAYSKVISRVRKGREEELNLKYQALLKIFQENPCETTRQEMEKVKSELEALYDEKVEGIIIRSRARWHEHGEKNSKYFLNLEKWNNIKKHIRKLFVNGVISTDPFEILNTERRFYEKLYSKQNTNVNSDEANSFLNNPDLLRLPKELSESCEGEISLQECENILNTFQAGKTPGNDGIPVEFYRAFWPLLGKFMVDSFNVAYVKKEMSHSQKQAIITLIEKKGKDRNYLENWRPISLINVDAKIASKVIAARVIKVLPEIIHCNQMGYVKGRFIGEAARSIIDVMDYTKKENVPGLLLFIDFEKAFDSIDWEFMLKCLDVFEFGPSIKGWIETFYKNITSCVINNGMCTSHFEIQRGVRQGDPLSPYLFIIVAEVLATAIRSKPNIQGIKIGKEEFKIVQYADDLTAFVPDVDSAQHIFVLLNQFQKCSGLKVNYTKTEAMWIGSCRNNTVAPLGLKWVNTVKALGIVFTYNETEQLQKNFYDKLKGIRLQTRLWRCRGLSLLGKITIIKSFLLSKMTYVFSVLPTSQEFIKQLNTIIFNFLWNGSDKITRLAAINDIKFGGLRLIDIETSIKSLRLAWLGRIFLSGRTPWKAFIDHLLDNYGGIFFVSCNYDIKDYNFYSIFYNELLQWWDDFRNFFSTTSLTAENIIWNNKLIKIDGKSIYYHNYVQAGITLTSQMQFNKSNVESYNIATSAGLKHSNFLTWSGIRSAIPGNLKVLDVDGKKIGSLEFYCGEKLFDPLLCKSKQFYELLITKKAIVSRGFTKLKNAFGLDDSTVSKVFLNLLSVSSETFVRSFQFKLLNDIVFTNKRLAKIGYVQHDTCTFCKVNPETVYHLFYECPLTRVFWENFENFWFVLTGQREKLTLQDVYIGNLEKCELLNYFITLAKLHIWLSRKQSKIPKCEAFIELVDQKYRTEKYIAVKNNTQKQFQARWQLYR